jgi:hypothetical protein
MIKTPLWTREALVASLETARRLFREERMREPLEAYLEAFERYQGFVEDLLETTVDLTDLENTAVGILTDPNLLEAFRYLAGPPLSEDDLKTLSESVLSAKGLRADPDMIRRIIDVVRMGVDRYRFPWVGERREPTEDEKAAAVLASAALLATSRVSTNRRNEGKEVQERQVEAALMSTGFTKLARRKIETLKKAPGPGKFCRESALGKRKADFVVGLWDGRVMAIECKVSNSATVKAKVWLEEFGTSQVVPVAVLSGVYKLHNLEDAQNGGLTLFWAHDLAELLSWIRSTKSPRKRK